MSRAKNPKRPPAPAKPDISAIYHRAVVVVAFLEVAAAALDTAVEDHRPPGAEIVVLQYALSELKAVCDDLDRATVGGAP